MNVWKAIAIILMVLIGLTGIVMLGGWWSSREYNKAYNEGRITADMDLRIALLRTIQAQGYADVMVPISNNQSVTLTLVHIDKSKLEELKNGR